MPEIYELGDDDGRGRHELRPARQRGRRAVPRAAGDTRGRKCFHQDRADAAAGQKRVGTLRSLRRQNARLPAERKMTVLYLVVYQPPCEDDDAHYEVAAFDGFQFAERVGVLVPRTERELQRQVAYMTGRYREETQETAAAGADHYQMTREMRDTIRMARNGMVGKLLLIFSVEKFGDA
jgi:hypothetical protein